MLNETLPLLDLRKRDHLDYCLWEFRSKCVCEPGLSTFIAPNPPSCSRSCSSTRPLRRSPTPGGWRAATTAGSARALQTRQQPARQRPKLQTGQRWGCPSRAFAPVSH